MLIYCKVIIPVYCFQGSFWYSFEAQETIDEQNYIGSIVRVEFGRKTSKRSPRKYIGIISSITLDNSQFSFEIKNIKELTKYKLNKYSLDFFIWFTRYNFLNFSQGMQFYCSWIQYLIYDNKKTCENHQINDSIKISQHLSQAQQNAYNQIIKNNITCLFRGVTGSGKNVVYKHVILYHIKKYNKQVLLMVPEVNIANHLFDDLRSDFGDNVCIWSSSISPSKKKKFIKQIYEGTVKIIISTRSGIFLPYDNLSLIIVDEENDQSYSENMHGASKRYNGRDMAITLGYLHGAKVILSSATPSLESYNNVINGKYDIVKIDERYNNYKIPEISIYENIIYNIQDLVNYDNHEALDKLLGSKIILTIVNQLRNNNSVLVFLNKTGYEKVGVCNKCNKIYTCEFCDVYMTYYCSNKTLKCNICNYKISYNGKCISCNNNSLKAFSAGIEQIEAGLKKIISYFSDIKDKKISTASSANKDSIDQFINGKIDILIATQVAIKSFTFDNLTAVIILDLDLFIKSKEFRAIERTYSIIHQAIGRAGRTGLDSYAILSSSLKDNQDLISISQHSYEKFAEIQLEKRKALELPPFTDILVIEIYNSTNENCIEKAVELASILRSHQLNIIGPFTPGIRKIKGKFIQRIIILNYKLTIKNNISIRNIIENCIKNKLFGNSDISIELNPYNMYY